MVDRITIYAIIAYMPTWKIPDELAEMLRKRRVIPFVGSGLSAILGLPDWNTLLSRVAEEVQAPLPFEKVNEDCQGDPLQIAEYYFLISDRSIGPLRFAIAKALTPSKSPVLSGAHVELVNLGMPQIYTTNFDDLIEQAFRGLKQLVQPVVLPKHIASAGATSTQVIKYHGDLRHDATLVLTESSYYERLDFESPMDLKFRSDLLGRSVLFMGYSFKDINIRVIWFKLMDMMKDIPVNDRPTSFILRLNSNPALERLYEEVGIKTIVLDPSNKAITAEQKATLLNDFMFTLASLSSSNSRIPGTKDQQQFFSAALGDLLLNEFAELEAGKAPIGRYTKWKRVPVTLTEMLEIAGRRTIPPELQIQARLVLDKCAIQSRKTTSRMPTDYIGSAVPFAVSYSKAFGLDPLVTFFVSMGLGRNGIREALLNEDSTPWESIWAAKLTSEQANELLKRFESEVDYHTDTDSPTIDHDLAYIADPIKRILSGEIYNGGADEVTSKANELIQQAGAVYLSILQYTPSIGKRPNLELMIQEIDDREAALNPPDDFPSE